MAQQTINIGGAPNDGTGDSIRDAFGKVNANDTELYAAVASNVSALAGKAPLASPALTGTPTAPTAGASTNTTQIATTAMVQAALAAYIAAQDVLVFKGAIDCSTNPNYPAADAGHVYRVSVAGKIGGSSGKVVEAGDVLTCVTDSSSAGTQASVGANWIITQVNLDGAVIGPSSATDARIAVFDGTTGKILKDGGSTIADLVSGASDVAATIHAATAKTTPIDADELGLVDSADSNALKKLTFANIKAWVKSWISEADVAGVTGIRTITATGSTVDVDLGGVSYIVFNQASPSTINTFSNAKSGKLYYFWFQNGNTTINRNKASLIGGSPITFTTGQGALFVGEGSSVRQVNAAVVAS